MTWWQALIIIVVGVPLALIVWITPLVTVLELAAGALADVLARVKRP